MADDTYHITPQWNDLIVYDEGEGRRVEFDAGIMEEPYQVTIPGEAMWTQRTPAWAHDRRQIIVDRLRASGCIIEEFDVPAGTWSDGLSEPKPIASLNASFRPGPFAPAAQVENPIKTKAPLRIFPFFWLGISLIFVAGGIWQIVAGRTMKDHLMGALCAVFFALCALAPLSELRHSRIRRKFPRGQCAECGYNLQGNVSGVCPECGRRI